MKFEAKGREFAKILKSLEQFIQTVKEQFLVSECFFNLILEVSQKNCNSNWKKILGVRNMQEKLENTIVQIPDFQKTFKLLMLSFQDAKYDCKIWFTSNSIAFLMCLFCYWCIIHLSLNKIGSHSD